MSVSSSRSSNSSALPLYVVQRRRKIALTSVGLLIAAILPFVQSSWALEGTLHENIEFLGVILIALAILGRAWCTLYIGGRKLDHLVTEGPYSISRNPLYVFTFFGTLGVGAQTGSLLAAFLLAFAVFLIFAAVIGKEEEALAARFPGEFADYRSRVPRFGPRLSTWHDKEIVEVSPQLVWHTVRDALPLLLSVPFMESLDWLQSSGYLPVILHLP